MKNNNNGLGLVNEKLNTEGSLIITNNFINALAVNRNQSRAMTTKNFATVEHFRMWKKVVKDFQQASYEAKTESENNKGNVSVNTLYKLDIAFTCIMNFLSCKGKSQFSEAELKIIKKALADETTCYRKDNGDEASALEGKILMLLGEETFRKLVEIILYDKISGKKHRSYDEQIQLKEQRALRRKAKREAEKAEKAALAAQKAQNSEVVETFQGEVVGVTIPDLTLTNN